MIAYCGMDCDKCEGYLATQENSDVKKAEVAQKWSEQHNADIKPDQINCNGCKSEGIKFFFTENVCPIRKCNVDNNTAHCAVCSQYRCNTLKEFIKEAPIIGEALEALR